MGGVDTYVIFFISIILLFTLIIIIIPIIIICKRLKSIDIIKERYLQKWSFLKKLDVCLDLYIIWDTLFICVNSFDRQKRTQNVTKLFFHFCMSRGHVVTLLLWCAILGCPNVHFYYPYPYLKLCRNSKVGGQSCRHDKIPRNAAYFRKLSTQ